MNGLIWLTIGDLSYVSNITNVSQKLNSLLLSFPYKSRKKSKKYATLHKNNLIRNIIATKFKNENEFLVLI